MCDIVTLNLESGKDSQSWVKSDKNKMAPCFYPTHIKNLQLGACPTDSQQYVEYVMHQNEKGEDKMEVILNCKQLDKMTEIDNHILKTAQSEKWIAGNAKSFPSKYKNIAGRSTNKPRAVFMKFDTKKVSMKKVWPNECEDAESLPGEDCVVFPKCGRAFITFDIYVTVVNGNIFPVLSVRNTLFDAERSAQNFMMINTYNRNINGETSNSGSNVFHLSEFVPSNITWRAPVSLDDPKVQYVFMAENMYIQMGKFTADDIETVTMKCFETTSEEETAPKMSVKISTSEMEVMRMIYQEYLAACKQHKWISCPEDEYEWRVVPILKDSAEYGDRVKVKVDMKKCKSMWLEHMDTSNISVTDMKVGHGSSYDIVCACSFYLRIVDGEVRPCFLAKEMYCKEPAYGVVGSDYAVKIVKRQKRDDFDVDPEF